VNSANLIFRDAIGPAEVIGLDVLFRFIALSCARIPKYAIDLVL
jgi:hypothetical protein